MDDSSEKPEARLSTTRRTTRTTPRANGLMQLSRARYRQRWMRCWLTTVLVALAVGCSGKVVATSLPPPPVPSDEAIAAIEALGAQPNTLHLLLWLDEQERYFEGIECWLQMKSAVDCEFD